MIALDEIAVVAERFGARESQVARDHLISHVLAALAEPPTGTTGPTMFLGGTALCRTWCPDIRLSEDIDLLVASPDDIGPMLKAISNGIRREYPNHSWTAEGVRHQVDTRMLRSATSTVQVQFIWDRPAWNRLPVMQAPVALRYSDLPATADLPVPTAASFVALKVSAWLDRSAPRDLFDLAALADHGHINNEAIRLTKQLTGASPAPGLFAAKAPKSVTRAWDIELGHQLGKLRSADECLSIVRDGLRNLRHKKSESDG